MCMILLRLPLKYSLYRMAFNTTAGLEKKHLGWIKRKVEEGYEESRLNFTLFPRRNHNDLLFPNKEAALISSLATLTRAQIDFMMRRDVDPFQFRIQHTYHSLDDLRTLLMPIKQWMLPFINKNL